MILTASLISAILNLISMILIFRMITNPRNRRYSILFFNLLTISGAALLILKLQISDILKNLLFSLILFPAVLKDQILIFEPYNVEKKITILSFGYTKEDYFFKFLIPKNIPKLIGSIMKFLGVFTIFLFFLENRIIVEKMRDLGIILIITGVLVDIFSILTVEKR